MINEQATRLPQRVLPLSRGLQELRTARRVRRAAAVTAGKLVVGLVGIWSLSCVLLWELGVEAPAASAWINYGRLAVSAAVSVRLALLARASGLAAAAAVLCLGSGLCVLLAQLGAGHDVVVYAGTGTLIVGLVGYAFTVK